MADDNVVTTDFLKGVLVFFNTALSRHREAAGVTVVDRWQCWGDSGGQAEVLG